MFHHTHSGGAANLHNVAIETKDLCRHLVDKGHRPAHLVLIFKDVGNTLHLRNKHEKHVKSQDSLMQCCL